ncbi:ATP-grasp domain-containing protein [Streptomyces sp. NPDC001820]|uniref:ATP-grasp domain-containing protein n=1 Tax=Streptomyces sp. NPDC001820 TaxID=3364613 RepID=UPI0036779203
METILVVGGRPETLVKAKEIGLRVLSLQHKDRLLPAHVAAADALFLVDYTDWELTRPLVETVHEVYGFTHVVSLAEQCMETVGRINDLLGLPGTSEEVSALFKDKLAMREHLAGTDVPTVAAASVEDADAIRAFGAEHGYPVVLKPIGNTASRGVRIIDSADDVDQAWREANGLAGRTDLVLGQFFPVDRFLVEEFIGGPEYSVETFSFDGRHSVVAITEKYTWGVVEAAHALPARISPQSEREVVSYIRAFLDAMGLRDGLAHTEIKITDKGPRVIESHNRIAGERIPDLVISAYEIDLEQYSVGAPFGLLPELPDRPEALRGAATRFFAAEPGRIVAIHGADEVREHEATVDLEFFVGIGDTAVLVVENFDRSGQVLARGVDTAAAADICDRLAEKISFETVPDRAS